MREHPFPALQVMLEDENAGSLRERQAWSLAANVVGRRHCRDALTLKFGKDSLCLHDAPNADELHDPLVVVMIGTVRLHGSESCMLAALEAPPVTADRRQCMGAGPGAGVDSYSDTSSWVKRTSPCDPIAYPV